MLPKTAEEKKLQTTHCVVPKGTSKGGQNPKFSSWHEEHQVEWP